MNTIIDIFNNIFKFGKDEINIIIDEFNEIWFAARPVAKLLLYRDTDDAIRRHCKPKHKTKVKKIQKYMFKTPPYMKPDAIFISEPGLYSLMLSSKMPAAQKFKDWILEQVLPSIRKTGFFKVDPQTQDQLDELNDKLNKCADNNKKYRREIKILRHNQKKVKGVKTGTVYARRPVDTRFRKMLKLGKIFEFPVKDPEAVEKCAKNALKNIFIVVPTKNIMQSQLKK